MKTFVRFLILLTFFAGHANAQSRKIMSVPTKYLDNPDGSILTKSTSNVNDRVSWIVCSDRDNNRTYKNKNGTGEFMTMKFMEKFYVTDEEGDYLQLYKFEEGVREGGKSKNLKSNAVFYGWAPKSRLLLWMRCLENERHLAQRALPILKGNNFKISEKFIKEEGNLRIYNDPGLSKENGNAIKMFQFIYIYKQEGNSLLVGKVYESNFDRIDNHVLGWIPEAIVQHWGDRICLEPNWEDEAVTERKDAGVKSAVFISKNEVQGWKGRNGKVEAVWDDDPYQHRKDPFWKRFPVLGYDESGLIRTGYVTNILNEQSKSVVSDDEHARVEKVYNETMENARKINVIFVIDGGNEMKEYLSTARHVVAKMTERRLSYYLSNNIRYGMVLYRDEQDVNCPGGNAAIVKTSNLSTNSEEVLSLLDREQARSGCKTSSKGVGMGLDAALRMIGTNTTKDQTNIVILIGGAKGKDNAKFSEEKLAQMIADYKVNLLTFQVIQGSSADFDLFPKYVKDIIVKAIGKSTKSERARSKGKQEFLQVLSDRIFRDLDDENNTYMIDYPVSTDLMGLISFIPKGQQMNPDLINNSIDSIMSFVAVDIDRKVDAVSSLITGMGKKEIKLDPSIVRYLNSIGEKIEGKQGQDIMAQYNGKTYQFFIPAYASLSVDRLQNPVFKRVLYLSVDELFELKETLKKLTLPGSSNEVRNSIVDAYTAVLASYLGDDKAKENISKNKWRPDQVLEYVTGLKPSNELLSKYAIADFKNPAKVPEDAIGRIRSYLSSKFERLTRVMGDKSILIDTEFGTFYWISEDLLP